MATQFKSKNSYGGVADLAAPAFASLRPEEIGDRYMTLVDQYGGSVYSENDLRSKIRRLSDAGVFEKCRYFDAVDARWGSKQTDGKLVAAYSLAGDINIYPSSYYRGGNIVASDDPGVPVVTDNGRPYWLTQTADSNGQTIYKGLVSGEAVLPSGGYYVFGGTDRNLNGQGNCGVALGTRRPADGNRIRSDQLQAPVYAEWNAENSWAYADDQFRGGFPINKEGVTLGSGIPSTKTMFVNEPLGCYGRYVEARNDNGLRGNWYVENMTMADARNKPVMIGANNYFAQSWNASGFGRDNHPSSFCNFFLAVTTDSRVIESIHEIMAS